MLPPLDWRVLLNRVSLLPLVVLLLVALSALVLFQGRRRPAVPGEVAPVWAVDMAGPNAPPWTIGAPVPGKPFPGQKVPPCEVPREREVSGGCWVATEHKPPCPRGLFESAGRCLMPVRADVVPNTLGK